MWRTDDIAGHMGSPGLVVSLAGLATCAKLVAVGLSAILVPGGFGSGHQKHNAARLEELGAACTSQMST